jgi:hypothetical protein
LSDGHHSLLDISEKAHLPFATVRAAAEALRTASLLAFVERKPAYRQRAQTSPAIGGTSRSSLPPRRRSR